MSTSKIAPPVDYTAPKDADKSDEAEVILGALRSAANERTARPWTCDPTDGRVRRVTIVKDEGEYAWVSGLLPPPGFSRFDRLLTKNRLSPSRGEAERHCQRMAESGGH